MCLFASYTSCLEKGGRFSDNVSGRKRKSQVIWQHECTRLRCHFPFKLPGRLIVDALYIISDNDRRTIFEMANSVLNGANTMENDSFETDFQEILNDDLPTLNKSNSSVHSGSSSPVAGVVRSGLSPAAPPNSLPQVGLNFSPTGGPPASTTVPLNSPGSPSQNGDSKSGSRSPQSKIDTIKQWSISTYKCTRQIISEKLGKTSRTVDPELETQIETLRETQRKYAAVLRLSRALTSHFYHVVQTQHALGDVFADLAQKSPELQEEFLYNADTQRNLTKNGEILLGALNFFVSTVNTLCNKTIEDTLLTIKQYEAARVEFDAYRTDLEVMTQLPGADTTGNRLDEAQRNYATHKDRFERLRQDVAIKLKFLEENKVKVMHKQLLLFHNAVSAYFSGNQKGLEETLKQFNIKLKNPNCASLSWLEQ